MPSFIYTNRKGIEHTIYFDEEDRPLVEAHTWCVSYQGRTSRKIDKVMTTIRKGNKQTKPTMHKLILGEKEGFVIDHKDGNPLNNQKSNLQFVTNQQNIQKQHLQLNKKSGIPYKGVSLNKLRLHLETPYLAQIETRTPLRKCINLGYFSTPEEAALAYNTAATKYFGQHAYLNIVPPPPYTHHIPIPKA
jgi:hypothetical protein